MAAWKFLLGPSRCNGLSFTCQSVWCSQGPFFVFPRLYPQTAYCTPLLSLLVVGVKAGSQRFGSSVLLMIQCRQRRPNFLLNPFSLWWHTKMTVSAGSSSRNLCGLLPSLNLPGIRWTKQIQIQLIWPQETLRTLTFTTILPVSSSIWKLGYASYACRPVSVRDRNVLCPNGQKCTQPSRDSSSVNIFSHFVLLFGVLGKSSSQERESIDGVFSYPK